MICAVKSKAGYTQYHQGKNECGPVFIFNAGETKPPADSQHQRTYNNASYGKAGIENNRQIAAFTLLIRLPIYKNTLFINNLACCLPVGNTPAR
jgi:hypothetical protein